MSKNSIQLSVPNMSCGGCESNIKGALSSLPGVESMIANLSNRTINVVGDASASDIIKAVTDAGYPATELNTALE